MENKPQPLVLIALPTDLYNYLLHVVEDYSQGGIHPQEGQLIYGLWARVKNAQPVDFSNLGKTKVEGMKPDGVSLSIESDIARCQKADLPESNCHLSKPGEEPVLAQRFDPTGDPPGRS